MQQARESPEAVRAFRAWDGAAGAGVAWMVREITGGAPISDGQELQESLERTLSESRCCEGRLLRPWFQGSWQSGAHERDDTGEAECAQ